MGVRDYNFIVGPETSTLPTAGTPSVSTDIMTKGYADSNYTPRADVYGTVTDITALKAIGSSSRFDEQLAFVAGLDLWYEFDADSSATADDDLVVQPTSGTGRWLKIEGGGGSGSGAAGLDVLIQKVDNERMNALTTNLDNSAYLSGQIIPASQYVEGNLLQTYSSGASTIEVVWNAVSYDANYDSATGWSAVGAGASLALTTTGGEFKVGTGALKFDKNGTATQAGIRYDKGAQTVAVGANTRAFAYIYLPSTTNLTNVYMRVYKDSTSNYKEVTATTQSDGSGLSAAAWNLVFFDFNTAGTTGGTGWSTSDLSRYLEIGVTTSSAGQTYTGIIADSMFFSLKDIAKFGVISNEFTLFDTSVTANIIFSSANTVSDGKLTLAATVASTIVGGLTVTARGRIKRSTMTVSAPGSIPMDNDSNFSGNVTTTQYLRIQDFLRESLSGAYSAYVDQIASQMYPVSAVGGSTVDVTDPANQSANLKNGDTVDVFEPLYVAGEVRYTLRKSIAMTSDATHSSGTTTLTFNPSSVAVGDIVVKRTITEVAFSGVSKTANENFSAMSVDASPNGVKLIGQFQYPYEESVWAHWALGAENQTDAVRNRKGVGVALTPTGAVSYNNTFLSGRYAAKLTGSSQDLALGSANTDVDASGETIAISFWFNDDAATGSTRALVDHFSGASGYLIHLNTTAVFQIQTNSNNLYTSAYSTGVWNHILLELRSASGNKLYINGALVASNTDVISASGASFYLFQNGAGSAYATGVRMADMIIWRNAPAFTLAQVSGLYNSGTYLNSFNPNILRLSYTANGQSGQRASMRVKAQRTTTAVTPQVYGCGFIKSS